MVRTTRINTCLKIPNFEVKNTENALKVMETKKSKILCCICNGNIFS